MLLQDLGQRGSAESVIVRDHLDETRHVGEEVALVMVGEEGGHGRGLELDVLVVDLDEVNRGVRLDQRNKGVLNGCGDFALSGLLVSRGSKISQ